jgi:hypothetical protein
MQNTFRLMAGLFAIGGCVRAATFTVAPGGNDANPGTSEKPFATLAAARDAARKAGTGPQRIVVRPGAYFLTKTLELDARDNCLTIKAAEAGKTTLYGGTAVTGWRRDGEQFWCADVAGVQEGAWDFRALVVNGRMPDRARLPATGTFIHKSVFDVRWLSSVGGGWERKPTPEELTTLLYDAADVPATLDTKNAEVRVYHMWDESLLGVASNDVARHALTFKAAALAPPGAYGVKKYVIFNTREGLTRPGQWYLDRTAGRIVYWPLPGEDMTRAQVVAPRLECAIKITGTSKQPAEYIALRGLVLQATTTPLKSGGFGAFVFDGALRLERAQQCVLEQLEICNVGGQGVVMQQVNDCQITGSHIHHTGACGIKADGTDTLIASNHVHHVGCHYPSAVALSVSTHAWRTPDTKGFTVLRNEIHDAPYSGIIGSGGNHLFEENLITRVMRELQDGGAIYGGMANCILRGNIVRDVVKMGEGYGVSSYYLDEGAQGCIVERNVSIGVERPVHNHIARNLIIRDNVFSAETNMVLSFQRSASCTFTGNTLYVPGKLSINQPSAIKTWTHNAIIQGAPSAAGAVAVLGRDDAMPPAPKPEHKANVLSALRVAQPPKLDGAIGIDEWPGRSQGLDREPSREPGSGAPVFAKLAYDDQCLYVALTVAVFEAGKLRAGTVWGQDDGVEICLAGKTADGKPVTFVLHGFAGGAVQSVTAAGAPAADAERLGKAVRFAAKPFGKTMGGWRSEWAIPWSALGLQPATGLKFACNLAAYRSEDGTWRCLEGTLAENWRVDQAGWLQLK